MTDYLPEERARGITIQSAAITFPWAKHSINLIDTPGHADFTFEVARSLRVLDGAVAILDGVAGVEAQTEKVWRQADEWALSRVAYVNKMDRTGAGFGRTVREIYSRLGARPIVMQLPVFEGGLEGGTFKGVVDIIEQVVLTWSAEEDGKSKISAIPLAKCGMEDVVKETGIARTAMMETLAELDDQFLEYYLEHQEGKGISGQIRKAIRSLTIKGTIVPVFCGASLRDVGVEPLLDAIVHYLPSPKDRPPPLVRLDHKNQLAALHSEKGLVCALAFKVIQDALKGPLVFVRVYQGSITKSSILLNIRTGDKERANRLLRMYADDSVEINAITDGNIGVVLGLKNTITGDTIVNKPPSTPFHLLPIPTSPPVFIASIEPHSLGEAQSVSNAIQRLLREDPSLTVTTDEDTGQLLLGGMGELHLQIARDRLINEFDAKCEMGKVRVSYRETLSNNSIAVVERLYEKEVNGKPTKVGMTVEVSNLSSVEQQSQPLHHRTQQVEEFGNIIDVNMAGSHTIPGIEEAQVVEAICAGVRAVLQSGPTFQLPLHSVLISVRDLQTFETLTTYQSIVTGVRLASQDALKEAISSRGTTLMEPFMKVVVTVNGHDVGRVVSDLTAARGGMILSMDSGTPNVQGDSTERVQIYAPPDATYEGDSTQTDITLATIIARVPLKEMVGYSTTLRSLTQGRGTFVMSFQGFERMTGERASAVQKELTGLE